MEKTDKAVSTEDLCIDSRSSMCLEAAKLEALFKTLVENKVEAIKNDKVRLCSVHSSPKSLVHRLRVRSSSSVNSSKYNQQLGQLHHSPNRKKRRRKRSSDDDELADDIKIAKRSGVSSKNQMGAASPESLRFKRSSDKKSWGNVKSQDTFEFLHCDSICSTDDFITSAPNNYPCCCPNDQNGQINMHYNDYVSLKIEDFEDTEEAAIINREALRRARKKRRKRRKRRMKRHMEITPLPVPEIVKELDPDELPQRARWTIVATACLLLFMCLLLVGVTLRMAPIIDDMVRKENEELMNSLHRVPAVHQTPHNSTATRRN